MEKQFIDIMRTIAHISEKMKSLCDEYDKLYEILRHPAVVSLFTNDKED